ncbi:Rv3654c family TadE-like protein [Myceligenerans crystallogenes]|uniref:D-alanyl-D-alanine carboxypeptidase-like core domain-containing protein n=1 Tax=Myceligenerans crystallogenes TaxID=316335 RepID=A0ABN2N317_9MICO
MNRPDARRGADAAANAPGRGAGRPASGPDQERGAGAVMVLGIIGAVLLLTLGLAALAAAQHARGAAQAAADLGALAGAAALRDGYDECARASAVVGRNGAETTSCTVPAAGVVRVEARTAVGLPGAFSSPGAAHAAARAGLRATGLAGDQGLGAAGVVPGSGVRAAGAGGHTNGQIPPDALCELSFAAGQRLRCDAAAAAGRLNGAFRAEFGRDLSVTDSYRSYAQQVAVKASKGALAAPPGMSNHGWGQALDLGGGIESFGSAEHLWMAANAARYGWIHPAWARPGGSKPEPWHWEYGTGA